MYQVFSCGVIAYNSNIRYLLLKLEWKHLDTSNLLDPPPSSNCLQMDETEYKLEAIFEPL